MASQLNLFEELLGETPVETPTKIKTMAIEIIKTKKESNQVSKKRRLINSRLRKIEKLEKLIAKDATILKDIKTLYHKNLSKDSQFFCEMNERYLEMLIKRLAQKSFSRTHKGILIDLIAEVSDDLMQLEYQSEKVAILLMKFEELREDYIKQDRFFGEMEDFHQEMEREILGGYLENMGLDDEILDNLDLDNIEETRQRIFEHQQQREKEFQEQYQRERVLNTDQDFSKLYRKLVKEVHPDLTRDSHEKKKREVLMKQLSDCWEQRDYYRLLQLQVEILGTADFKLSESNLKHLSTMLYEKIQDLEAERYSMARTGDNAFFYDNFYAKSQKAIENKMARFKKELLEKGLRIKDALEHFKNQKTTKAFLSELHQIQMDNFVFDIPNLSEFNDNKPWD